MINLCEKVYIFLYCLTFEDGTDILCRNVGNCVKSEKREDLIETTAEA
jgi:hypothetical protein